MSTAPLPRDANGQIAPFADSTGQAAAPQLDGQGNVPVTLYGPDGQPLFPVVVPGDSLAEPATAPCGLSQLYIYNGAQLMRVRAIDNSTNALTALATGRQYQSTTVLNAVAITDTAQHLSGNISIATIAGPKVVEISSTLNQPVTSVEVWLDNHSVATFTALSIGTAGAIISGQAAATGVATTWLQVPAFLDPYAFLQIGITCATAPTAGSVSAVVAGLP